MSGLRILVPVKRVLDYAVSPPPPHHTLSPLHGLENLANTSPKKLKPRIKDSRLSLAGLKHSLNPFDELAIEEAIRLRERHAKKLSPAPIADIIAFSAGPAKAADVLRTALAMGADRAIHVLTGESESGDSSGELEPLVVAKVLRKIVEDERVDVVLCGKQSISDDSAQTGPMLAGLLGWSVATQIAGVKFVDERTAEVTREVDGGTEVLRMGVPAVWTTDLRLNEPRYASLPNIMKAKKKKIDKITAGDLGVDIGRRLKTLKVIGESLGSLVLVDCEMLIDCLQNLRLDKVAERSQMWMA
jgi:electron transfer flavoprotein beta subunit